MKGLKYDTTKPRWDLLPYDQLEKVVNVLTMGAVKYADDNWKDVEPYDKRYFAATMRHLTAWKKGELVDEESGQPHLAHAICCLLFMMWKDEEK